MSKIWEPSDPSVYMAWLDAIQTEASDALNDWESNFIESISNHLAMGRRLSEAQALKLADIYARYTK